MAPGSGRALGFPPGTRTVVLEDIGREGLSDRIKGLHLALLLGRFLAANVTVPRPCDALLPNHTAPGLFPACTAGWDRYLVSPVGFHGYRSVEPPERPADDPPPACAGKQPILPLLTAYADGGGGGAGDAGGAGSALPSSFCLSLSGRVPKHAVEIHAFVRRVAAEVWGCVGDGDDSGAAAAEAAVRAVEEEQRFGFPEWVLRVAQRVLRVTHAPDGGAPQPAPLTPGAALMLSWRKAALPELSLVPPPPPAPAATPRFAVVHIRRSSFSVRYGWCTTPRRVVAVLKEAYDAARAAGLEPAFIPWIVLSEDRGAADKARLELISTGLLSSGMVYTEALLPELRVEVENPERDPDLSTAAAASGWGARPPPPADSTSDTEAMSWDEQLQRESQREQGLLRADPRTMLLKGDAFATMRVMHWLLEHAAVSVRTSPGYDWMMEGGSSGTVGLPAAGARSGKSVVVRYLCPHSWRKE